MKNYLTDTDRKITFRLGALLIALLIGCAFPHQRMLICTLLFAVVGLFSGIGGALVGLIVGFIVSFNAPGSWNCYRRDYVFLVQDVFQINTKFLSTEIQSLLCFV